MILNNQVYLGGKIDGVLLPSELEFFDQDDEERKCLEFKERLVQFQRDLGVDNFKIPQIGGKELNLCKLFKQVVLRGGFQRVTDYKLWKEIVNQFEIPSSCTSASFTLKSHYMRCLLQYEIKFYDAQAQVVPTEGLQVLKPGIPHIFDPGHRQMSDSYGNPMPLPLRPGPGRPPNSQNKTTIQAM